MIIDEDINEDNLCLFDMVSSIICAWRHIIQKNIFPNIDEIVNMCLNSLRPSDIYMRQQTKHQWFR